MEKLLKDSLGKLSFNNLGKSWLGFSQIRVSTGVNMDILSRVLQSDLAPTTFYLF